jgi:hypothetical protein
MDKKDYKAITVIPTPCDDTQAGLIVSAEFIKEFGGEFINGEYFPPKEDK